ncbi:MAG TPA: xanthine dehydrogenase family protein subunit M [Candidatus Acidoferrales bacterium]
MLHSQPASVVGVRATAPPSLVGATDLYFRPATLNEALQTLSDHSVQILSGGTDFYPSLGDRPVTNPVLDISALRELRGIHHDADFIRIGGLTTWTDVIAAPLPPCFDALKAAAREVGSIQIQNRGTVAGNLCNASPAADGVPPLLALDAEVELVSREGKRRMPLSEFLVGNRKTERRHGEILTNIYVPRMASNATSVFLKLGARRYLVISISMVAAVIATDPQGRVSDARIAIGSCSATARRLPEMERALIGADARAGLGEIANASDLAALSPIDDIRATGAYRRDASLTLVRRAVEACVQGSTHG